MIELINIERAKEGIAPVQYDYNMTLAATIRALEMHYTKVFEHARYCPNNEVRYKIVNGVKTIDYSWCKEWYTVFDDLGIFERHGSGENIAKGFATVSGAMNGFMNSPSHKKNIMNPNFKYVGIGIAENSQTSYYFAQEFRG